MTLTRLAKFTVLWTTSDGVRCVLAPYDETRYQLRLMRDDGTIKSDLFVGYAQALAASREWRHRVGRVDVPES